MSGSRWTPPPNWPVARDPNWKPWDGWKPDPAWGPAPAGWNFYPEPVPWWRRRWVQFLALGAVALLIGVGIGSSESPASPNAPAAAPVSNATRRVTELTAELSTARHQLALARGELADAQAQPSQSALIRSQRSRIASLERSLKLLLVQRTAALHQAALARAAAARAVAAARSAPTTPPATQAPSCTLTSTGHCIQGGEFCPDADEGSYGYDAAGDRYICRDGHWENP